MAKEKQLPLSAWYPTPRTGLPWIWGANVTGKASELIAPFSRHGLGWNGFRECFSETAAVRYDQSNGGATKEWTENWVVATRTFRQVNYCCWRSSGERHQASVWRRVPVCTVDNLDMLKLP